MTLPTGWVLQAPLTFDQAADVAFHAGFRGEALVIALAVARAESGLIPNNRNVNTQAKGKYKNSIDRGLWQINNVSHPEFSDETCDTPNLCAGAAYLISAGGSNWKQWSTFTGGQYKAYLPQARAAADRTSSGQPAAGGATYVSTGGRAPDALKDPGPDRLDPTFGGGMELSQLKFVGRPLTLQDDPVVRLAGGDLSSLVVSGGVDFSTQATSQVELVFDDPGLELLSAMQLGLELDWLDIQLVIAAVETVPGTGPGSEQFKLTLRSRSVERLSRGLALPVAWEGKAPTLSNVTPGQYLDALGAAVGVHVLGEAGAVRSSIAPQELQATSIPYQGGQRLPVNSPAFLERPWAVAQRLAAEEGFWLWEASSEILFGRPSYLINRLKEFSVVYDPPFEAHQDAYAPIGVPECRKTLDGPDDKVASTVTVHLPRWRGEQVRPGMRMNLYGAKLHAFVGSYLVTRVQWPFDGGVAPVVVDAVAPVDPRPTADTANTAPATTAAASAATAAETGNAPVAGKWENLDAFLTARKIRFGAPTPGQTTGGTHAKNSLHYTHPGRARDYGNSNSDVAAIAAAFEPYAQGSNPVIVELFHQPTGTWWKNGARFTPDKALSDQHRNHVHVGVSESAVYLTRFGRPS